MGFNAFITALSLIGPGVVILIVYGIDRLVRGRVGEAVTSFIAFLCIVAFVVIGAYATTVWQYATPFFVIGVVLALLLCYKLP